MWTGISSGGGEVRGVGMKVGGGGRGIQYVNLLTTYNVLCIISKLEFRNAQYANPLYLSP